jgi:O-succinylhomoserine sulfhydrylase
MRSFAEEKDGEYIAVTATQTQRVCRKVCKMEGQLLVLPLLPGMAAVYSTMAALLKSGDHIVSSSSVFRATHSLFVNYFPWNIQTSYFDINEPETIESFITPDTKILLLNRQQILQLIL